MYRESETVQCSAPMRSLYRTPPLKTWGSLWKGGGCKSQRDVIRPSGGGWNRISGHKTFELTEAMAAHAGQARFQTNSIPVWRREMDTKFCLSRQNPSQRMLPEEGKTFLRCSVALQRRFPASEYSANTKWTLCFCCYFVFAI